VKREEVDSPDQVGIFDRRLKVEWKKRKRELKRRDTEHAVKWQGRRLPSEIAAPERARLLRGGLGTGEAALQEFDLAIVVGLVFGYVKPLGVVVPAKIFV
jgi:hypothetical protein